MSLNENDAKRALDALLAKYYTLSEPSNANEKKTMSESSVVRQYIDILLRDVLGWPIEDPARYKYELHTAAGRPDMTLLPESGGVVYVEAKKFGVLKPLRKNNDLHSRAITPAQLALPGIATDRTSEEQQAINYAFQNNAEWAILTNFEVLRLFNARRDWLVLSFEEPAQYRDDFDLLWQLAYPNLLKGSLNSLSNQRLAPNIDAAYLDFINEWRQRLAVNLVARVDKNPWLRLLDGSIDLAMLRSVVQQFLDRLVVTRFAEDWLVIPPGTLRGMYDLRRSNPYSFTMDQFLDQFFRRFDEDHNSALFALGVVDQASFDDETLMPLVEKLYEVRYRAMPADILGNTYEQYLGKALTLDGGTVQTRDNLETRKKQGSYYTPQVIVRYLVRQSLGRILYGTEDGTPTGTPVAGETRKTVGDIRELRILDSACGSGSFLIEAYYVLKEFYEAEVVRIEADYVAAIKKLALGGDISLDERVATQRLENEVARLKNYPRLILESHLYGVDLDPQAAEVAVVNLIMRAMERSTGDRRLPLLLNQNIKVGNGLVGLRADDPRMAEHLPAIQRIGALRAKLVETPHGAEHDAIVRELGETSAAVRAALDAHIAPHFSDLARVRPFHWGLEFPEVFYREDALTPNPSPSGRGPSEESSSPPSPSGTPRLGEGLGVRAHGFAVVIGNPPWEIVKPDLREYYAQFDADIESKLTRTQVEARIAALDAERPERRAAYDALDRATAETALYVRKGGAYTRQGRGDTATHKLFTERMWNLLEDGGRLGYVIPSGFYKDLGTKDLRQMLLDEGSIQYLHAFSNVKWFFPGVNDRVQFVLLGASKGQTSDRFWASFRFDPRVAVSPNELPTFLADRSNHVQIETRGIERFSPDSLSVMEFQTRREYEIAEKIYGTHPLIGTVLVEPWNVRINREFDITNDRALFTIGGIGSPLYEGKMIHQYDAFYSNPQYWIAPDHFAALSKEKIEQINSFRLAHRRIARSTDERTLIAAIVPRGAACENNASTVLIDGSFSRSTISLYVCALFNSFVLDYVIRYKVSTTLNMFYIYSLPLPRLTAGDPFFDALVPRAARLTCTRPEFADLWRETMGTEWVDPALTLNRLVRY